MGSSEDIAAARGARVRVLRAARFASYWVRAVARPARARRVRTRGPPPPQALLNGFRCATNAGGL